MAAGIPHDLEAEDCIIGTLTLYPAKVAEEAYDLEAEDFYNPKWAGVWLAFQDLWVRNGIHPHPTILADRTRQLGGFVEGWDLLRSQLNTTGGCRHYVDIVKRHRVARDVMRECQRTLQSITDGEDPYELSEGMQKFLSSIGSTSAEPESMTFTELSETAESLAPWVIPELLRSDWKCILTGFEGSSKSTTLKAIAMMTAQGVHPFRHKRDIEPRSTLVVDLENPAQAIVETGSILESTLRHRCGSRYDDSMFHIWRQMGSFDIRRRSDRANLQREIAVRKPKLVCIGPLYRMYRRKGNENYEDAADSVIDILNELRTKYEFALMVEHHVPKGTAGFRGLEPMGSQRWMAWPEIGLGLRPNPQKGEGWFWVEKFRGDRLQSRWPDEISRDPSYLIRGVYDGLAG